MPHIIWRGAVSFGLVHVPVKLYPATSSDKVGFHLLDRRSMDPIGYQQINKRSGKLVPKPNIVKGYEYEKGKYVVLSDDEIRSANPESTQTIDILAFVDASDISFLYLDTPYFLAPDRGGDKVYALLRESLLKAGKIGVASVVLHSKQHLAALIPMGDALALNTLRWATEVRDTSELKLPSPNQKSASVSVRDLEMAERLIEDMTQKWDPGAYRDTFHDDILSLVDRKIRAGKTTEVDAIEAPHEAKSSADILDLSDLLRRSLKGGAPAKAAKPARLPSSPAADDDAPAPASRARKTTARATAVKSAPATKSTRRKRA
jgi:DNA end-binding protein Ku